MPTLAQRAVAFATGGDTAVDFIALPHAAIFLVDFEVQRGGVVEDDLDIVNEPLSAKTRDARFFADRRSQEVSEVPSLVWEIGGGVCSCAEFRGVVQRLFPTLDTKSIQDLRPEHGAGS